MFERVVLGVDPGIATAGLAVLGERNRRPELIWARSVRTPSGLDESARLRLLYGAVRDALTEHHPESMAVERLMWGRNVGSAMTVARATGVVLLAAADAGVRVDEYPPLEVKMAVTGIGNAGKDQVRTALVRTHRLDGVPAQPDAADAVAVALCHLTQSPLRRLHREAARADVTEALAKVTLLALAARRRLPRWDPE